MKRLKPDDRKDQILEAALTLACESGYLSLTRDSVAAAAGCSPALVTFYFFAIPELRRQVMERAVMGGHPRIVAEGLALRDEIALGADAWVKAKAIATMGV